MDLPAGDTGHAPTEPRLGRHPHLGRRGRQRFLGDGRQLERRHGANDFWATAANWSDDTAPTRGDIAVFDGTSGDNAIVNNDVYVGGIRIESGYTGVLSQSGSRTLTVGSGGYVQAGGTFRGGRAPVLVNSGFILSGGTFVSPAASLAVSGKVEHTGGTYTHSGNTLLLVGSGQTVDIPSLNPHHLSLNDGLIGYWPFDETSGSLNEDKSGIGAHLTRVNSPTFSTDVPPTSFANARSVQLTVNSDSYPSKDLLQLGTGSPDNNLAGTRYRFDRSQDFSVAIWVKTSGGGSAFPFLVSNEDSSNRRGWGIGFTDSTGRPFFFSRAACCPAAGSTTNIKDGEWHHIVGVRRGNTAYIYVDGVVGGTTQANADVNMSNSTHTLTVGWVAAAFNFVGLLDDLRIYNRALTEAEITALAGGGLLPAASARKTLAGSLAIPGNLTISGGTLDVSSSNHAIALSGSWVDVRGGFVSRDGTVTFDGSSPRVAGSTFSTLAVAPGTDLTLSGNAGVSTSLSIGTGSTLSLPGYALTATNATISNSGTISETSGGKIAHAASLSLPASISVGSTLTVTLTDGDENADASTIETTSALVMGEAVTLTENAADSGIFTGTIQTKQGSPVLSNGVVETDADCALAARAVFTDPEDGGDVQTAFTSITTLHCSRGGGSGSGGSGGGGGGGGGRRGAVPPSSSKPALQRSSAKSSVKPAPKKNTKRTLQSSKLRTKAVKKKPVRRLGR